ncbi:MAG: hypothetical protein P8J50_12515 [Acidimicrobiales bacterium]|nr:hypothetical protein [Acidimicrobiales bacterium]
MAMDETADELASAIEAVTRAQRAASRTRALERDVTAEEASCRRLSETMADEQRDPSLSSGGWSVRTANSAWTATAPESSI